MHPPASLERKYKGVRLEATIEPDGRACFAGERFDSLSTAAGMARKSVIGEPPGRLYPQTNGWTFWSCRDGESGELHPVDDLRQRYLRQAADAPGDWLADT